MFEFAWKSIVMLMCKGLYEHILVRNGFANTRNIFL